MASYRYFHTKDQWQRFFCAFHFHVLCLLCFLSTTVSLIRWHIFPAAGPRGILLQAGNMVITQIFRLGTSCSAFSDFSNDLSPDVAPGQNNPYCVPHGDGLAQVLHLFPWVVPIIPWIIFVFKQNPFTKITFRDKIKDKVTIRFQGGADFEQNFIDVPAQLLACAGGVV